MAMLAKDRLPFHYGWLVVGTGTLCIMASLGFGRFALGMLLPSMGASLGLTYSEMGYISTGNFAGYLVAVLLSGALAARIGSSRLIALALLLVGASMLLIGRSSSFTAIMALYFLTGLGSGASNIPMMGLVSAWFSRRLRGTAAGYIVIGSGMAIMFSGEVIPRINAAMGAEGWRTSWALIGGISVAVAALCAVMLRDNPGVIGLGPVGASSAPPRSFDGAPSVYRSGVIYHLGAIYFLFGFTYVIYATFIVTSLVHDRGFTEAEAGVFWSWAGLLSLLSGPVFGALSDRLGRRAGFMAVFALHGMSYALAAVGSGRAMMYMSVAAFGVAAWSIPSIMAAAVGDCVGAKRAPEAFGFVTFIFALGQISGPALAGVLADRCGSFTMSFAMASALCVLAAALSAMLRLPGHARG